MKKIFIIIFCFPVPLISTQASADAFKLFGGMNLLKYKPSPQEVNEEWHYQAGFCVGAGIEFHLNEVETLALEVDALIAQKKGKEVQDPAHPERFSTWSLDSLRIPALAKIKFKSGIPFYVLGGGEFTLLLSHKLSSAGKEFDLKKNIPQNNLGFGVVLGCGWEQRINRFQSLFIDIRYCQGFSNLLKQPYSGYSAVKNGALLAVIGIKTY